MNSGQWTVFDDLKALLLGKILNRRSMNRVRKVAVSAFRPILIIDHCSLSTGDTA